MLWRLILASLLTLWPTLALAAGKRCPDETGLRSTEGAVSTSITFTNRMPMALRIYWIDYKGSRRFYGVLGSGQSHHQQTYVTHPWVLTDGNENCIAVYMPAREPKRISVTGRQTPGSAAAPPEVSGGADKAKPVPKDTGLAGTWLGLQPGVRFPLACDSGEPVHYSADGTYAGPGARGTWQLQDGQLTEIVKEIDAEIGDPASVKIGEPYESRIEWKGPDTFVRTSPGGASMTFRRCPETASADGDAEAQMKAKQCVWQCLENSKGTHDPRYRSCVDKTCLGKDAARSKAAEYLVREQIAAACEKQDGRIDPASVIERDLNGDGKDDLIIHHHGIACTGGGRSIFCGAQACSFLIYVRRGALLTPAGEFLGVETIRVEGGPIPTIHTVAHGGKPTALRWNGREFRWR